MPTAPTREIVTSRRLTQADLKWLVCPVCRGSLALSQSEIQPGPGNVASQSISCVSCTLIYPVADNLPILLSDRATRPR